MHGRKRMKKKWLWRSLPAPPKAKKETGCLIPGASDDNLFTEGQSVYYLREAEPTYLV